MIQNATARACLQVLANDINSGYQDYGNIQVLSVNGQEVHSLAHLAQVVTTCEEPFVRWACAASDSLHRRNLPLPTNAHVLNL